MRPALALLAALPLASAAHGQIHAAPRVPEIGDAHLRVDVFGYAPAARKVAVLREPLVGFDAPDPYVPGATVQVRRAADGTVAFEGPPTSWNGGATHDQSGDRAWWFDFTALTEAGAFYLFDPVRRVASEEFRIDDAVYRRVAKHALRMYLHQRCGVAKSPPAVRARWSDTACHLGPEQDLDCRSVLNPVPATSRDLSGGWHDAGDYNRYVNYADDAVHGLLIAWETAPAAWGSAWGDDLGLPESGNGLPDLLDELRVELEWMLRMQLADGSVTHKLAVIDYTSGSPPSTDPGVRRYSPATASATVSAAGAFARAARVYRSLPDSGSKAFATTLQGAALAAWSWLEAHPSEIPSHYDNQGFWNASAEDDPDEQWSNRLRAAAQLFALTGDTAYRAWFDAHYLDAHLFQWGWASPWEDTAQDALLAYAALPGATPAVAATIRSAYMTLVSGSEHLGHATSGTDAYRAWLAESDTGWGSNRVKCLEAALYADVVRYGLDPAHAADYREAALGYLHYVHGVNPLGLCFLTNMDEHGGGASVRETYHAWFGEGTAWDHADAPWGPPPGYQTGGPNPSFAPDPAYGGTIEPPQHQPTLKSYRDWNTDWPENSWEVTECHIPYQAAYLRLLSLAL